MSQRVSWIARVAALLLAVATPLAAQTRSPSDPDVMIARGERLAAANRLEEAGAIASAVLSRQPESARAHYLLGLVHDRQRNFDQAVVEYRAALARAPNLADAHDHLGFVLGI